MTAENLRDSVHLVLANKSGTGKSIAANFLAQFLANAGLPLVVYDTDTGNNAHALAQYKAHNAKTVNILNTDNNIDLATLDGVIDTIIENKGCFVVDSSAIAFRPLFGYLFDLRATSLLRAAGKRIYIHTVVFGGDILLDTTPGLLALLALTRSSKASLVVWQNEINGPAALNGLPVLESPLLMATKGDLIAGSVVLERLPPPLTKAFGELMASRETVNEYLDNESHDALSRQRVALLSRRVFDQLEFVAW